jgi:1,4-alpha-glucan branching enzyme
MNQPAAAVATTSDRQATLRSGGTAPEFDVRSSGSRRVFRVFAPGAQRVELSADFTGWEPVALVRGNDGWWTLTRTIAAGTYQVNMRTNGGSWTAPPGLLTTRDEFGGVAGVLKLE